MRAPSRLLFAGLSLALIAFTPEGAFAEPGARHGVAHQTWTKRPGSTVGQHRAGRHVLDRRRHGQHFKGSRKHRYGFFPHRLWYGPYLETEAEAPIPFEESEAPAQHPALMGIPSIADLPVSSGIVSAPPAPPTIYVLNARARPLRRGPGGAKVISTDQGEPESMANGSEPRIIHLDVSRGR